jgi:hypothetical protein
VAAVIFNPADFRLLRREVGRYTKANPLPSLIGDKDVVYRKPTPPTPSGQHIAEWGGGGAMLLAREGCYRQPARLKGGEH